MSPVCEISTRTYLASVFDEKPVIKNHKVAWHEALTLLKDLDREKNSITFVYNLKITNGNRSYTDTNLLNCQVAALRIEGIRSKL